jgi:hypothetical protein
MPENPELTESKHTSETVWMMKDLSFLNIRSMTLELDQKLRMMVLNLNGPLCQCPFFLCFPFQNAKCPYLNKTIM